jgi:uncharacterized phage protein (TIGR01671 family)
MREIKFRMFYKKNKKMWSWNNFNYRFNKYENDENFVIMQYTGLKDKNGKEIYEGDIITDDNGEMVYDEVIFCKGTFCIKKGKNQYHIFNEKNVKVLGNIYENNNLIK